MNAIEFVGARITDLGNGLQVRRLLPTRQRRMVGAWCFLDHAGPLEAGAGGMHVGAHPHTGLQTFTWLIEGEVLHRDSLGSEQLIRPGQVNLMTAGRGIVHTEDSLPDTGRLHLAQLWIALPASVADCAPAFDHYPDLPCWDESGCSFTLLAGDYCGRSAPARLYSPLLGMDICSGAGAPIDIALRRDFEYAILPLSGSVTIDGQTCATDKLAYLGQGRSTVALHPSADCRMLLLGGEPFATPVLMWWNFVGRDKAGIAAAQHAWESGDARFGRVNGDAGRRLVAPRLPWSGI
ncbi:MAG: pirin family protein [Chitinivorax sp.]